MLFSRKFVTTSSLMTRAAKRANPGLGLQISAIRDAAEVIQSDPEGFGELESDLFNAHQSHKDHELDLRRQGEQIRLNIVKNKYFRQDPLPNLLTYAEKEHIKFLHSTDGQEWTIEKLAESFPANAEIIRKILKANWTPMSLKRARSHDANVLKNWERFKNGEYKEKLSDEFSDHLKKFADRRASSENFQNAAVSFRKRDWQKPRSNEFSSIISSLQPKGIDSKETKILLETDKRSKELRSDSIDNETHLIGKIKNKKPITIHQLKSKHVVKSSLNSNMNNENYVLDKCEAKENIGGTGIVSDKENFSSYPNQGSEYAEKFMLNEVIIDESDRERYGMCDTKQRIYIPRKLWRKGATYRTNNSYYDDDGEFLYKVPGMALK